MSAAASGRKANNDAHQPRWIGLRPREARDRRQRGGACCQAQDSTARISGGQRALVGMTVRPTLWQCGFANCGPHVALLMKIAKSELSPASRRRLDHRLFTE